MLSALLLSMTLHAGAPHLSVLVSRRTLLSASEANGLAQRICKHLAAAGVPLDLDADAARASLGRLALNDAAQCSGRKACVTELGRQLGSTHVLSLSVSQVGTDRSIALELVLVDGAVVLEREALVVSKGSDVAAAQLEPLAQRLKARLVPPAPVVVDRPVVEAPAEPQREKPVDLAPAPAPPAVVVVQPEPAPRSRALPLALGAAGAAVLIVSAVACSAGALQRQEAYRTETVGGVARSPWTGSEVQARAASGSAWVGAGAGGAAVGLGLLTAALVTW